MLKELYFKFYFARLKFFNETVMFSLSLGISNKDFYFSILFSTYYF